jgi:hypothetical protein
MPGGRGNLTDFQQWWLSQQTVEEQVEEAWQPDTQLAALRAASMQAGALVPTAPRRGQRKSSTTSTASASTNRRSDLMLLDPPQQQQQGPSFMGFGQQYGQQQYEQQYSQQYSQEYGQQYGSGYGQQQGLVPQRQAAAAAVDGYQMVNSPPPGGTLGKPPEQPPPARQPGRQKSVPGWQQRSVQPATKRVVRRNLAGGWGACWWGACWWGACWWGACWCMGLVGLMGRVGLLGCCAQHLPAMLQALMCGSA